MDARAGTSALGDEITRLTTDQAAPDGENSAGYEGACARLLHLMRQHVGMKVAWISEFVGVEQVFRMVDVAPGERGPDVGSTTPLNDAYCSRVLAGTMPAVIPNVRDDPTAVWLDVTLALQIGSYLGVPLHGLDGTTSGMLCMISDQPTPNLDAHDLTTAQLVAQVIDELTFRALGEGQARRERSELRDQVTSICAGTGRLAVLHPIVDLRTGDAIAAEGLTRFADRRHNPAGWFAAAHGIGLGAELELAAARGVLDRLADDDALPVVGINLSPEVAVQRVREALDGVDPARVVLELTEYAPVADYDTLAAALEPLRATGMRLAVDDAGAGYSSMSHVLRLKPDIVKIDMALVRDVDTDPIRQALVVALVRFADAAGSRVVAEGIETHAELMTLVELGVPLGQGYLFGQPCEHPVLRGHPHCDASGALVG